MRGSFSMEKYLVAEPACVRYPRGENEHFVSLIRLDPKESDIHVNPVK